MTDERDFTSYVTARWAQLVRALVASGASPAAAHRGAAETLSRCHDDWDDRDEWADLDVHVVRDAFERWQRRREEWWSAPVSAEDAEALEEAGWPDLEPRLDQLAPADREALVVAEILGLSLDQVREVTRTEARSPGRELAAELHAVLDLLPVDPPPVEEMVAASERRHRRRRTVSLAALVIIGLVAGLVTTLVVRHDDSSGGEPPEPFATVRSVPYDNPSPVAWYAAGTLFLSHSQLELRDVRAFAQWRDGAVYLDIRGNLITVSAKGDRARITTLPVAATFGVYERANEVIWVDPRGPELVAYDLIEQKQRFAVELPDERTRLLDIEGSTATLDTPVQLLRADLRSGEVDVVPDDRLAGELDRTDGYALTRTTPEDPHVEVVDLATGQPISIDIDESSTVTAARFGPDGSLMVLIEPPSGDAISEIRRCPPPDFDDCRALTYFPGGGAPPLLAF